MIRALLAALILWTAIPAQADPVWIGEGGPNRRYQYRAPRTNVNVNTYSITWWFDGFVNGQHTGSFFLCFPGPQETICNTIANDLSHFAGPNILTDDIPNMDLAASDLIQTGKRKATDDLRWTPEMVDDLTGESCTSLDILGCSIALPIPTEGWREVTHYQFVYTPQFATDALYVLLYEGAELVYGIAVPEQHVPAAYPFYRSFLGDHGRIRVSTADGKLMTNRTSIGYKSSDPESPWFDMAGCPFGTFGCEPLNNVPVPGVYLAASFYQVTAAPFDYAAADGERLWLHGYDLAGSLIQSNSIKTNDAAAWPPLEGQWGNHSQISIAPDGWTHTRPNPVGTTEALSAQPNPDINNDGCVNIADFGIFKANLGQCADWNGWDQ